MWQRARLILLLGFYSKLVRLKDLNEDVTTELTSFRFYSKLVRLKGYSYPSAHYDSATVSIPNWCD